MLVALIYLTQLLKVRRIQSVKLTAWPSLFFIGGGKAEAGYQKSSATHSYGAGALNEEARLQTPKVLDAEKLGYSKSELAGTSGYGAGAVGVEQAINAPKIKHEGLGQVDKKKEMVHQPGQEPPSS